MLRSHREPLLNWFRAKGAISSGAVAGFNNQAKLTTRKAYGFRTFSAIEIALSHTLGALPAGNVTVHALKRPRRRLNPQQGRWGAARGPAGDEGPPRRLA